MKEFAVTTEGGSSQEGLDDLMIRYQQADKESADAFVNAVSPILFSFFCHRTGNLEAARDLLQEAWLQIHKSRNSYRAGLPVWPWLFGIAHHVRVDGFRINQRINHREKAMDLVPEMEDPEVLNEERLCDFETLINPLSADLRAILTMLKVAGMSLKEIAIVTDCTVGSVKQKTHRAYQTLRKLLRSSNDDKEQA